MNVASIPNYIFLYFLAYSFLLLFELETLAWFLKPTLIPLLFIWTWMKAYVNHKQILLFALLFSWLGDVLLMFAPQHELFFITGLISFLTAHILYIVIFKKSLGTGQKQKFHIFSIPLIGLYLFFFLNSLWNDLGELKIPVVVYALTISTMLWMSIRFYLPEKTFSSGIVLLGALFFVISDSILAWNKFHEELVLSSFLIMSTYLLAQFFIVFGLLKEK